MDKLLSKKFPTMKDYNNWPSREAVIKNKISYHEQQSSIERLPPCTKQDFSKTDTGFFKDKKLMGLPMQDLDLIIKDPIAREVE